MNHCEQMLGEDIRTETWDDRASRLAHGWRPTAPLSNFPTLCVTRTIDITILPGPVSHRPWLQSVPKRLRPMKKANFRRVTAALLATVTLAACSSTSGGAPRTGVEPVSGPGGPPRPATGMTAYAPGDVDFMTGMIGHHLQAVLIAGWAPAHGASPTIRTLTERIVVGQNDEIAIMERWLRDHGETVPDLNASHAHDMAGMDHTMLMPGMLTAEQLAQLDQARGPEFDRLFLTFMIQHHQGALVMVDKLFGTQGAGENETVFRIASDIYADQSTEIDRMQKMLTALPARGSSP